LYQELIAACHWQAAQAEGPALESYQGLLTLIQPWLTLSALVRADGQILSNLLIRCREVQGKLEGRSRGDAALRRAIPMLGSSLAVILVTLAEGLGWPPLLDRMRDFSALALFTAKHSSPLSRLFVVSLVVVGISTYLVSRTARG